ncbi:MAG: hypothetical protein FWE42_05960 [Defluviitaleaceae bacterium]|nr:hypothetical protein [Defluviitaleaceae bacterium]
MKLFKNQAVAYLITAIIVVLSIGYLYISNAEGLEADIYEELYVQAPADDDYEEYEQIPEDPIEQFLQAEEEPEYKPILEQHNGLGITAANIIALTNGLTSNDWYPTIKQFVMDDGTIVESALFGGISRLRLFTLQSPDNDYPSTIILRVASNFRGNMMQNFFPAVREAVISSLAPDYLPHVTHGSHTYGDWRLYILCLDNPTDFDFGQLPHTLADFVENDFLMSEERGDELIALLRRGDFLGMESLVRDYIDEVGDSIEEGDTAFWVLEHLEPLIDALDLVEIHYDSFDDVATIFFRGLTDIGFQNSFVPHTTTRNAHMYVTIGFHSNEHINASRARIQLENGVNLSFTMSPDHRSTISGSEVREGRAHRITRDSEMSSFLSSRAMSIRFEGSRNIDRDLSEAEQVAFIIVNQFRETNYFSNLWYAMRAEF